MILTGSFFKALRTRKSKMTKAEALQFANKATSKDAYPRFGFELYVEEKIVMLIDRYNNGNCIDYFKGEPLWDEAIQTYIQEQERNIEYLIRWGDRKYGKSFDAERFFGTRNLRTNIKKAESIR